MIYHLQEPFVVDGEAPARHAAASTTDLRRAKIPYHHGFNRVIGGDKGDLLFDCYSVDNGHTTLENVAIATGHDNLTDDEVMDIAREIFTCAFASIGWDAVT